MAVDRSFLSLLAEWWLSRLAAWPVWLRPPALPPWLVASCKPFITRELIEDIQLIRLRRVVAYAAAHSPFYRERLNALGSDARRVRTLGDLSTLPFTTSDDLAEPERFLCVPLHRIGHVFATSGTTGEPKRIYFTFGDFRQTNALAAAILLYLSHKGLPVPPHVVALIALPQGLWIGSRQAISIVERLQGLALPVGLPQPVEMLGYISRFRPGVLITSPSYLGALTRSASEKGLRLFVPFLFVGGERLLTDQAQRFAEFWQAHVVDVYGTTEIGGGQAISLPGCRGLHLNEVGVLAEIVDPETGAASDRGELVLTTLRREAMPILRYRTGDIVRWVECGCGLPLRAFVVEGRADDMFIAGGMNMYGHIIATSLGNVKGTTGRVEVVLRKVGLGDRLELSVERLPGHEVSLPEVQAALWQAYPDLRRSVSLGSLDLVVSVTDSLEAGAKSFRIVDHRREHKPL